MAVAGQANLTRYFKLADPMDIEEAKLAYIRYKGVMAGIALRYGADLMRTTAAFVALSPNSDYMGNLRSLVSVLEGIKQGVPAKHVVISTYNHCKMRAYNYLLGNQDFLANTRGLKTINFYHNIIDPTDTRWVTVDGHVVAAHRGRDDLTMKQALLKPAEYKIIKQDVMVLACEAGLVPNQYQAAIWFARKRHLKIRYNPQFDLFSDKSGITWDTIAPYPFKKY